MDPATGKKNYAILQAEDEIAAIGMAIGAGWNGARAFTATSGPGISLMQEFFGLAYFAEIPVVVFDVQRGGPSTGMPTRTQQSDLLACAFASHGDTKHVLLIPDGPGEAFEFAASAFDLAERLQTVVFVMLDLDIGMNSRLCAPFQWDDAGLTIAARSSRSRNWKRRRISVATTISTGTGFPIGRFPASTRRAAPISPAAPAAIASPATPRKACPISTTWSGSSTSLRPRAPFCRGQSLSERRNRRESAFSITDRLPRRWMKPSRCWRTRASMSMPCASAHFHSRAEVADFIRGHDRIFVVEQNRDAQMRTLISTDLGVATDRWSPILHFNGMPTSARYIYREIAARLRKPAAPQALESIA